MRFFIYLLVVDIPMEPIEELRAQSRVRRHVSATVPPCPPFLLTLGVTCSPMGKARNLETNF